MRTSCPSLIPVAANRLSQFQRRILAWLAAEEQRTRGTIAPGTRTSRMPAMIPSTAVS
jgi:hypothetical protein